MYIYLAAPKQAKHMDPSSCLDYLDHPKTRSQGARLAFAGTENTMSWSDLPAGLVTAIADELTELADLARFRSVCPSWRLATAAQAARLRVPLLLLPTEWYDTRVNRRVWSVADDRLRENTLPAALGHAFLFASQHGWILAVAGNLTATLVYPFAGGSASLPELPSPFRGESEKIIRDLTWDWSPHGVVVSPGEGDGDGEGAFFCRSGDGSWVPVGCSSASVTSVTYCDGAFYLLEGHTYKVTVLDAEALAVVAVIEPPALEIPRWVWNLKANLVVSPDELLLLLRTENVLPQHFQAFRAERATGSGSSPSIWSEVAGVGDRAVFVDHLRAFCVEANGLNRVRRNCVYVASSYKEVNDDYGIDVYGRYTVSVFDCADLKTENLGYGNLLKVRCSRFWQWPSWSLPMVDREMLRRNNQG